MGIQPFYQKYGVQTTDPSRGLLEAQAQQKSNLNDVLKGIEGMMKNQEGQIIQANTQDATDLLKQKIQERGLGVLSNPIDLDSELRSFGNMIDRKVIDQNIKDHAYQLTNNARNLAATDALNEYDNTQSLGKAANKFQQKLVDLGMPISNATAERATWTTANANLPLEYEAFKTDQANTIGSTIIDRIRKGDNRPVNELLKEETKNVRPKEYAGVAETTNTLLQKAANVTPQKKEQLAFANTLLDQEYKGYENQLSAELKPLEMAYTNASRIPDDVVAAASKMNTSLGGIAGALAKDADNGLWKGTARGILTMFGSSSAGSAVADDMAATLTEIKNKYPNIPQERLTAIGMQAYNDRKTIDSAGAPGTSIEPAEFKSAMLAYAEQENTRTIAYNAYAAKQKEIEGKLLQAKSNITKRQAAYSNDLYIASLRGTDHDPIRAYETDPSKLKMDATTATTPGKTNAPQESLENKVMKRVKQAEKLRATQVKPTITFVPASNSIPSSTADEQSRAASREQSQDIMSGLPGVSTDTSSKPGWNFIRKRKISDTLNGVSSAEASIGKDDKLKTAADTRRGIIDGINIGIPGTKGAYATSETHLKRLNSIYTKMPVINNEQDAQAYITKSYPKSNVTGAMAIESAKKYEVPVRLLLAAMEQDSSFSTKGKGQRTKNPGNVGNNDAGDLVFYEALRDGVDAVAKNLSKRKVKKDK
jgi:hypothetical protein